MGRTIGRPVDRSRSRRSQDTIVMVALAVLLVFALIGVVSAGVFAAGKLSSSPKPTATALGQPGASSGDPGAVSRAHAEATAIVSAAQSASQNIVKTARSSAEKQARAILAAAHRGATATAGVPASAAGTGSGSSSSGIAAGTGTGTGAVAGVTPLPYATAVPGSTVVASGGATVPNLSGVPASWLVVAYNATFGSGPGSAGSISVINRGGKVFSGTARVVYKAGGSASASFSGIAPGQALVLPLNGSRYPGGGYTLEVTGVR